MEYLVPRIGFFGGWLLCSGPLQPASWWLLRPVAGYTSTRGRVTAPTATGPLVRARL